MRASSLFALLCSAVFIGYLAIGSCAGLSAAVASAAAPTPAVESSALDKQAGSAVAKLSQLADELYTAANDANRQVVYNLLQRMEELSELDAVRASGTAAGWTAYDQTVKELKQALSVKGTSQKWYLEAAKLKLASDALYRPTVPLWLQYEGILKDDENRISVAWQSQTEGRYAAAKVNLNIYRDHIDRFEIAALMQRDEGQIQALRDQVTYTERILNAVDGGTVKPQEVQFALEGLDSAASRLFRLSDGQPALAEAIPPGTTIGEYRKGSGQIVEMFIAAFVMAVLGFAGWRKYNVYRNVGEPVSRNKFK